MQVWTWDGTGHGTFNIGFNFGTGLINRHSHCVVSVCELSQPPGEPLDYPFIGSASMRVNNVAPGDDGKLWVQFTIDWGNTLNWRATFFIN